MEKILEGIVRICTTLDTEEVVGQTLDFLMLIHLEVGTQHHI